jgi:hypothetical protein
MYSFDSDEEYRQLKKEIKDESVNAQIYGVISAGLFGLAAMAFFLTGGAAAGVAAAVISSIAGAAVGVVAYKKDINVSLDMEELEQMRRAKYLSQVMNQGQGKSHSPMNAIMASNYMDTGGKWSDRIRDERQQMAISDVGTSLM